MKTHSFLFKLLAAGAILALAIAGYLYWIRQAAPNLESRFRTEAVATGDITQAVSANGTLNPVVLVSVGTQVSGMVKGLHADFNDHVEKGQVLLELDPALLQATAKQSAANVLNVEASLALATVTEARQRTLLAQDSVARQDYDQARQALHSARAQLAQARAQSARDRTNLAYATIRSPVSGVVVDRQVDVGQTVAASFQTPTLFRIAQDLRQMQIDSNFAEADIGHIKVGQPVRFNVDAFANRSFEGKVRQVRLNPTVQQNVVTYDVVVAVDNPEQILMPGMTAYVNVVVAERKNVLLLPNTALRFKPPAGSPALTDDPGPTKPQASRATVYILEGNRLRKVTVETGIADSRHTVAVSGNLKAGDRVVLEDLRAAAPTAQPGATVRMRMF
jgi:HlyD family secretion protein